MSDIRDADCITRSVLGLLGGSIFGGIIGASQLLFHPEAAAGGARTMVQGGRAAGRLSVGYALVGGTFAIVDCTLERINGARGPINAVGGGIGAGVMAGLLAGSVRKGAAAAGVLGILAGASEFGGGHLSQQTEKEMNKMMPVTKQN
jgi:hypothetical protein